MQQRKKLHIVRKSYRTETYKLNIIEKDDVFSPDPLNENMEKVEGALAALQTAVDGKAPASQADSLEGRVAALELKKVVAGTYVGNGIKTNSTQFIDLGFTPAVVISVDNIGTGIITITSPERPAACLVITESGFQASSSNSHQFNTNAHKYPFIAIA